ncbi:c-type cytochrome biogenesis protein CcsB [Pseudolysinimonas sp.]|jgi:cytochrome c-type biogenesis protein CcsB|uniref:c-type cytochrome biogenesis protein CcsB n=1 Tax=Pseudolysinimonas sp. TaxID=2680009 RepID=UPI003784F51F
MTPETLAAWSLLGVYSAAAVYVIAFIVFAVDLAKRSADAAPASARAAESATVNGSTAVLVDAPPAPPSIVGSTRSARVGLALTAVGLAVHVAAIVLRGIAAERVPWANMFEFALTGTGIIVAVFVFANLWKDVRFLGAYVTGLAALLLTLATINFYDAVGLVPLPPPLQSAWLVIHVLVAILGTGFFALGAGLSIVQILQNRREAGKLARVGFLKTVPSAENLERLAYRVNVIGFMLWTFTLIFGAIWAERAWGRYWGWDTKEVWTFVIWVVFAGYIHARATRGWRGNRSAILALVGFAAVLFNFTVVNLFFSGLHAYSGL